MYLIKVIHPSFSAPVYLAKEVWSYDRMWTYGRKWARRLKAEEVLPMYQELSAEFRSSRYTVEIEREEE